MADRLKVLFAGLAQSANSHVRNLRMLLGDKVEILADRANTRARFLSADMTVHAGRDLEASYGFAPSNAWKRAGRKKPDAVFVTNPNSFHLAVSLAAAERGCTWSSKSRSPTRCRVSIAGRDRRAEKTSRVGRLSISFSSGLRLISPFSKRAARRLIGGIL